MTHYTIRFIDGATMRVRSVFYNGKHWRVADPHNGRMPSVSVYRTSGQSMPRLFGMPLALILASERGEV